MVWFRQTFHGTPCGLVGECENKAQRRAGKAKVSDREINVGCENEQMEAEHSKNKPILGTSGGPKGRSLLSSHCRFF